MDNIKDAILRVSRRVRALDNITRRNNRPNLISSSIGIVNNFESKPHMHNYRSSKKLSQNLLQSNDKFKQHERKKFQEFLLPLEIPELKINDSKSFNTNLAKENWKIANSSDNLIRYKTFLDNQHTFNQVIELLIELTPDYLKGDRDEFTHSRILQDYEDQIVKYPDLPKFYFKDIVAVSKIKDFNKYIYLLTHCKIFNLQGTNSLNGVVNDILLYTHKLDNKQFASRRNVETFNYLIKYYGFDKNQSIFSRTLLLVMKEEGILPNIGTFNNLLKSAMVNSHIRSTNSNKFAVILRYLKLVQNLKLQVDLMTWQRVYSCINNIYLKEQFLNKVSLINLPITDDFCLRIIDDYMHYCNSEQQLVEFIENDLNYKQWRDNDKIMNKVIYFKLTRFQEFPTIIPNKFTKWHIYQGISKLNISTKEKIQKMLKYYEPDLILINKMITTLNSLQVSKYEFHSIVERLVYDFISLSGQNMQVMKKFNKHLSLIELKLHYLKLTINPSNHSINDLQLNDEVFIVPERLIKAHKFRVIKFMNQNKLDQYNTTITERLQRLQML